MAETAWREAILFFLASQTPTFDPFDQSSKRVTSIFAPFDLGGRLLPSGRPAIVAHVGVLPLLFLAIFVFLHLCFDLDHNLSFL